MAFTGAATISSSTRTARVTGLSLASGASGIIGNNGDGAADVTLPATFPTITPDSVKAIVVYEDSANNVEVSVTKAGAQITFENQDGANASGDMEIWIEAIHSINL